MDRPGDAVAARGVTGGGPFPANGEAAVSLQLYRGLFDNAAFQWNDRILRLVRVFNDLEFQIDHGSFLDLSEHRSLPPATDMSDTISTFASIR